MSVKTVSKDALRRMEDSEGLILQGCGGSLDEWVDGINDMLTEDGILLDGSKFHDCSTFEHDGVTCLLFPFKEDVKLDTVIRVYPGENPVWVVSNILRKIVLLRLKTVLLCIFHGGHSGIGGNPFCGRWLFQGECPGRELNPCNSF